MFLVAQLKVSASYEDLLRGFCTSATRATLARSRRWFGDEFCRRLCFIWSPLLIPTRFTFSHKPFSILYFHTLLSLSFRFSRSGGNRAVQECLATRRSGHSTLEGRSRLMGFGCARGSPQIDWFFRCLPSFVGDVAKCRHIPLVDSQTSPWIRFLLNVHWALMYSEVCLNSCASLLESVSLFGRFLKSEYHPRIVRQSGAGGAVRVGLAAMRYSWLQSSLLAFEIWLPAHVLKQFPWEH